MRVPDEASERLLVLPRLAVRLEGELPESLLDAPERVLLPAGDAHSGNGSKKDSCVVHILIGSIIESRRVFARKVTTG